MKGLVRRSIHQRTGGQYRSCIAHRRSIRHASTAQRTAQHRGAAYAGSAPRSAQHTAAHSSTQQHTAAHREDKRTQEGG
eukprot:2746966-Rhodomonas_salina.2